MKMSFFGALSLFLFLPLYVFGQTLKRDKITNYSVAEDSIEAQKIIGCWKLLSLKNDSTREEYIPSKKLILGFTNKNAEVKLDVNSLYSSYSISGQVIHLNGGMITQVCCDTYKPTNFYRNMKGEALIYSLKCDTLILKLKKRDVLTYSRGCISIEDTIVREGDVRPVFPGGDVAMQAFIKGNSRSKGLKAEVYVRAVVSKTGKLSIVDVENDRNTPYLRSEALRIVRAMPDWLPGTYYTEPVTTQVIIPVLFE